MKALASVIADSISPKGVRLTTMQIRLPKCLVQEFNTHRMFSRNSASVRAIPTDKLVRMIIDEPYIPIRWIKNQKGMQGYELLDDKMSKKAIDEWLAARDGAITGALSLAEIGLHKSIVNRVIEPWMWTDIVVTSTEWDNFFKLRCHHAASDDLRATAIAMRDVLYKSEPTHIGDNSWHLPYVTDEEKSNNPLGANIIRSVARCCRVSYTKQGEIMPLAADKELHDRLLRPDPDDPEAPIHASPLEHQACPDKGRQFNRNFRGWIQYRIWVEESNGSLDQF